MVFDDELELENYGNGFMLAVDIATGEIVRDTNGEALAAYRRIRRRDELTARLRLGAADETMGSIASDIGELASLGHGLAFDVPANDCPLLILALASYSFVDPSALGRCRHLAEGICVDRGRDQIPMSGAAFDAYRRVLSKLSGSEDDQ